MINFVCLFQVLILAVLDAARYFVRILEHRDDNEKINNYYSGATFLKLALDLNNMYTSRDNRHVCSRIQLQKICVVESDGSYYRYIVSMFDVFVKNAELF